LVLGKAKVMSYEDLEEARAKRVLKDLNQAAKGKGKRGRKSKKSSPPEPEEDTVETPRRGRKRKIAELDAPAPEQTSKEAGISNAPTPASAVVIQARRTQIDKDGIEPEPWRAPKARMF
jgi:hypothetical protein